jgi:hypothetical protein
VQQQKKYCKNNHGQLLLSERASTSQMASAPQMKITSMIVMCYAQRNETRSGRTGFSGEFSGEFSVGLAARRDVRSQPAT